MEINKLNIMIVEDESILALDLRKTLQNCDYKVCSIVSNGDEAIRRAALESPDLILMDIMISGKLNGIETAKIIRSQYNIPIVFLTALSDDETYMNAQEVSDYGYIIKPFNEYELKSVIKSATAAYKLSVRDVS